MWQWRLGCILEELIGGHSLEIPEERNENTADTVTLNTIQHYLDSFRLRVTSNSPKHNSHGEHDTI